MIPKRIHLIWIGSYEPPWSCIDTWRVDFASSFSDWEIWLWRDSDIDRLGLENREWYERTEMMCGKADIARYEILYRFGGVYIDADSIWLGRSLESVLIEATNTGFFGAYEGSPDLIMNGFFGSEPGHPILAAAISELSTRLTENSNEPQWVLTGPAYLGSIYQNLQQKITRQLATLIAFERLVASSWLNLKVSSLPELVAKYRTEGHAISLQLGFTTNELYHTSIDIGERQ